MFPWNQGDLIILDLIYSAHQKMKIEIFVTLSKIQNKYSVITLTNITAFESLSVRL